MASLSGGAVVRRDLLLPPPPPSPSSLYGPPVGSRPAEHRGAAADDEFKMKLFASAPNGFCSHSSSSMPAAAVGGLSGAASSGAPMMKTCFWCGYSSIRVSDLMTHMKSAHPQEYSANEAEAPAPSPGTSAASSSPQCLASAPSSSVASTATGALQPATSDDGSSARRYKCFSCEARFCRSGTLVDHMRRNHPEVCQPQPSEVMASAASPASTARRPSLGPAWPPPFSASERGSPADATPALSSSSSSTSSFTSSSASQSLQSSMAASRKRPAAVHQQPSESSTAEDDEDDDDLDIKVIRLVSQRGSCSDGGLLLRSAAAGESAALLGRLRASGWPAAAAGHFFRSSAGSGGAAAAATALASVEQKDIGSLLGALRAAGAVDMSGRAQYGSGRRDSPDSAVNSGSGGCADGSAAGMQGDAAGPCQAPAAGAGAGSIHLVRVSSVTGGLVGIGGAGAKVSSSSSGLEGGASSSGGPSGGGGGGLRAPEKYKCFWCDAHFRKRGKLMDHIDLFHKDSKQQTEVQAELLTGNGGGVPPVGPPAAADLRQQQQRTTTGSSEASSNVGGRRPSITGALLPVGGCKLPSAAVLASAGAASSVGSAASTAASTTGVRPAQPPTCRFVLRAATRVECEPMPAATNGAEPRCGTTGVQQPRTCRFYFGKLANPLTVPGGWPFGPHLMVRAASGCGLPCPPPGTPAAAAAAAMNFGLKVGPPTSAVPAYGAPYAVYCANGVGGGVRFYAPHSFLSKRSDAMCGAPFAPAACSPSAYGLAVGSFVGGPAAAAVLQQQQQGGSGCPERLLVPVHEAAAAATASLLHRALPPPKADSYVFSTGDSPLDLSSRNVRL